VKFPLADWIDAHPAVRHHLGSSGMFGAIRHPRPTAREVRTADAVALRNLLADDLGVAPDRVFLTHGATEANSAVLFFLASRVSSSLRTCRVAYPEYPPLFDGARAAGFALTVQPGPVGVALVSRPRNPEGDLWSRDRLAAWAEGAEALVVDETFREFADAPSIAGDADRRTWSSGSFTKFFAGDDFRVGFLVAPESEVEPYGRFHGLVLDELPDYSVACALACLRARASVRRQVARILVPNRRAWRAAFPGTAVPRAPVGFDRPARPDGDALAERCLASSVLVCPGSLFGDPSGVRLTLTRPTFPVDVAAYLAVRDSEGPVTPAPSTRRRPSPARRPRAGSGRARAGRA
jgi:aspartate/methionine/tyrosine aminotransferase